MGGRQRSVHRTESSDAALITYYQSKRHIFGKMKLEIFEAQGKLVDTLPPIAGAASPSGMADAAEGARTFRRRPRQRLKPRRPPRYCGTYT